jgi:hypothetical protein
MMAGFRAIGNSRLRGGWQEAIGRADGPVARREITRTGLFVFDERTTASMTGGYEGRRQDGGRA